MGHVPLLDELAIVAVIAVLVTVALSRLRLPTVAGLLAAGALAGPYGLGAVTSIGAIESLADVGVVLLLFTIGLEFSLTRLRDILPFVALSGSLQVGLTIAVATAIAAAMGETVERGVFYGFVFALSSTAIVLRSLAERQELDAPHGRFIFGALIFQDLCVVPMVLIVPLLANSGSTDGAIGAVVVAASKALVVVAATLVAARAVAPRLLAWVDASRSREVFLLAILALCIGTAWLTSLAGLSLALGAFLGGLVVADTEFGHRALGDILPLKDAFVSLFFVSLGMLFDVGVVLERPLLFVGLLAGFILVKGLVATIAAMAMRFPSRVAWLAGVGLAQFGEFGFVLTRLAESNGLLRPGEGPPLLVAGIASMFLTPLLVRAAPHVKAGERLLAPLERLIGVRSIDEEDRGGGTLSGHVVVVGFGLAGRLVARTLTACGVPFVVLELNADNVKAGREEGLPVFYADATSAEALRHARVDAARLVVLLMNDPLAAERVVDSLKRAAPGVGVLMRTRYIRERTRLLRLGANDVVAEEVEGAVEVIARLLRSIETPRNVIDDRLREVRADTQTSERKQTVPRPRLGDVRALAEMKIECFVVRSGSPALGRSAVDLKMRSTTGALVVGIRRGERLLEKPDPTVPFEAGDIVYCVGTSDALGVALRLFDPAAEAGRG